MGGAKKSRKWVVALIVILIFVAVGGTVFALWRGRVFGGRDDVENMTDDSEFNVLIEDDMDSLLNVISAVNYIYSGEATISDFILPDNEYEERAGRLNAGLTSMVSILDRLNDGPELFGVNVEINLRENYDGLKMSLTNDIGKYKAFVDLTAKFYQAFQNQGQALSDVRFDEYDNSVRVFVGEVETYFSSMQKLALEFSENNCNESDTEICVDVRLKTVELQSTILESNPTIQQVYINNIGDINYSGEGSVMYYINNLRVATRLNDEK